MNIKKIKILICMISIFICLLYIPNVVQANSDIIVLLDPGHGGIFDSGATYGELYETNITWKIATKVKEILDNTDGITGILSREEHKCPEIYQRGDLAKSIRSRFSNKFSY